VQLLVPVHFFRCNFVIIWFDYYLNDARFLPTKYLLWWTTMIFFVLILCSDPECVLTYCTYKTRVRLVKRYHGRWPISRLTSQSAPCKTDTSTTWAPGENREFLIQSWPPALTAGILYATTASFSYKILYQQIRCVTREILIVLL
jgi:hypothetical protein